MTLSRGLNLVRLCNFARPCGYCCGMVRFMRIGIRNRPKLLVKGGRVVGFQNSRHFVSLAWISMNPLRDHMRHILAATSVALACASVACAPLRPVLRRPLSRACAWRSLAMA